MIEIPLIQQLIDCLYQKPIEKMQEKLRHENLFPIKSVKINYFKLMTAMQRKSYKAFCEPVLITPQPKRHSGSLVETMWSTRKRNLDPPQISHIRHPNLARDVRKIFKETYLEEHKFNINLEKADYYSTVYIKDWISRRTGSQMDRLESFDIKYYNPAKYSTHVKPDHKPKLDNSINQELAAGLVVTANHPMVTALLANACRCFNRILICSLKSKWLINEGITIDQLNGHINGILANVKEAIPLEIDFSKYDKSQDEIALDILCSIMELFKMPKHMIDLWRKMHQLSWLKIHNLGILIRTKYQRRSGDILTFTGNTIIAMAVLAYTHDFKKAYGGVFGGDDSVVMMPPRSIIKDQSQHIAHLFNLIAKIENFPEAIYFSSRYLLYIKTEGKWIFVRDPLKAMARLGRDDMFCKEHIEHYYTSYKDNMKEYLNKEVRIEVAKAAKIRNKNNFKFEPKNIFNLTEFLADLINNRKQFFKLFKANKTIWERKMPKNMKEKLEKIANIKQISLEDQWFLIE